MNKQEEQVLNAVISDFKKSKGRDPKSKKEITDFILEQGGLKYLELKISSLTKSARHGAKLQYIKSLKHQCAEDEELVYFKKGGSIVDCGCSKKKDTVVKAQKGTVAEKFKAKKGIKVPDDKKILPTDTVHIQNPKTKKMEVRDLSGKHKQFKKLTKEEYQKQSNAKKNDIDTKGYKEGGKAEKEGKVNSAHGGMCMAAYKFKKAYRLGGSLNGIPFYLKGKPLPTAPKAEDRYKNGTKDSTAYLGVPGMDNTYFGESIKRVSTPNNAKILRQILFRHYPYNNDTIYREVPEHSKYLIYPIKTNVQPRLGFSYAKTPEYEILKRRFNTAWNLAK